MDTAVAAAMIAAFVGIIRDASQFPHVEGGTILQDNWRAPMKGVVLVIHRQSPEGEAVAPCSSPLKALRTQDIFARKTPGALYLASAPGLILACEAKLGLERLSLPTLERAYTIILSNGMMVVGKEPVGWGRTPSVKCWGRQSIAQGRR